MLEDYSYVLPWLVYVTLGIKSMLVMLPNKPRPKLVLTNLHHLLEWGMVHDSQFSYFVVYFLQFYPSLGTG